MPIKANNKYVALISLALAGALLLPNANAATCKTESQMTAGERNSIASFARVLAGQVQNGDVPALKADTIPAVAADFSGIAATAQGLQPLVQHATITVDDLYSLDASTEAASAAQTTFYCGTPVVVLNFTNLPPGKYAVAILHATGVPKPQQIALILSEIGANHWMLAGFFSRPMTELGHDGLWYWKQARQYAHKKMNWSAWFYYQTAASLLDPVDFLSSPNLSKLQSEADQTLPANLPGAKPMTLTVNGSPFTVTAIGTTTELGAYDLEVHYTPDVGQLAQLRDPVAARKQAIDLMTALLAIHPDLRAGFHGIWVRADSGDASVFALELPMDQIPGGTPASPAPAAATNAGPAL